MGTPTGEGSNTWSLSEVSFASAIFSLMIWSSQTLWKELGLLAGSLRQHKPSFFVCMSKLL